MSNRVWKLVLAGTFTVGIFLGYRLAGIPNLQLYKLVNIIGLFYNLLAVFVLSEVLVGMPDWKRICVEKIAPILLWVYITVPGGALFGAVLAGVVHRGPSAYVVGVFAFSTFAYGSLLGFPLEQAVVLPRILPKDIGTRWRCFGLILLATGMLLQLGSAISAL